MKRILLFLTGLLTGFAVAQGVDPMVPGTWFIDPDAVVLVAGILSGYAVLLLTAFGKETWLTHGNRTVILSGVISAIVGGVGGYLSLGWFADMSGWQGVVRAVVITLIAFVQSNLVAKRAAQVQTGAATKTAALLAMPSAGETGSTFIQQQLAQMPAIHKGNYQDALQAVLPLIVEYGFKQMNDGLRAEIQAKILTALRKAGILKGQNIGQVSLLAMLLVMAVIVSACAPIRHYVGNQLNELTSDGAVLEAAPTGLLFTPYGTAYGVILIAQGEKMATGDSRCTVTETLTQITCKLSDVSEPTVAVLSGRDVVASATYRRQLRGTIHQTILIH